MVNSLLSNHKVVLRKTIKRGWPTLAVIYLYTLALESCISVKSAIDLNETPVAVGDGTVTTIISSLGNDNVSVSGVMNLNAFTYKFDEVKKDKKSTTYIENKELNAIVYGLENIKLNTTMRNDSMFISPLGDYAGLIFNKPIVVQRNHLRARLKRITVDREEDTQKVVAVMKLKVNPLSFFHKHAKKLNASSVFPTSNIAGLKTDVDVDMVDIANDLNYELTRMGDLVPGWGPRGYVLGPTQIISASGRKLMVGTRIRAEMWQRLPWPLSGSTRLWRQTTNAHVEVEMVDNPNGNPYLRIVSANIRHFPGDFEQIIIRQTNSSLKKKGLNLDFPGFRTNLTSLEFTKIDSRSINVKAKAEFTKKDR